MTNSSESKGFWNTLGVAQYREGEFEAAIDSLKKSQSFGGWEDSTDLFFLAMSYQQLGDSEIAQLHYEQACQRMRDRKPDDIELRRFRREAEMLLALRPM